MSDTNNRPAEDKKKKWVIGIVCLIVVAVSLLSLARQMRPLFASGGAPRGVASGPGYPGGAGGPGGPGGRQMPGTRGQITVVSDSAITIQGRDGTPKTFTLTPATKITVDQATVAATDLKVGQRARVVSTDSKSATEVHVRTRPFGGRGGGRGGPGGSPGGAPAAPGTAS